MQNEQVFGNPTSWKPEVQTDDSGKWYGNALRFATEKEAYDNASALCGRWMMVREFRAAPSMDRVNYAWVDGALVDQRITAPECDPTRESDEIAAANSLRGML